MGYWYAVLSDSEDNDWGTGSFDHDEAVRMLAKFPDGMIAIIDGNYDEDGNPNTDPICIKEIFYEEVYGDVDQTTYYIAKPEYADAIYGNQLPICLDLAEVKRLAKEWDMTTEELLEQMNEASDSAIEEYGVYNG